LPRVLRADILFLGGLVPSHGILSVVALIDGKHHDLRILTRLLEQALMFPCATEWRNESWNSLLSSPLHWHPKVVAMPAIFSWSRFSDVIPLPTDIETEGGTDLFTTIACERIEERGVFPRFKEMIDWKSIAWRTFSVFLRDDLVLSQ